MSTVGVLADEVLSAVLSFDFHAETANIGHEAVTPVCQHVIYCPRAFHDEEALYKLDEQTSCYREL
jgi:hypothetical protein